MPKLTISQLRKIISEEVKILREGDKEDQAAAMAKAAAALLKAIESFKSAASAKAKSSMDSAGLSLEKHLQESEKMLKRIVGSPLQHVDGPKTSVVATGAKVEPAAPQPVSSDAKKVSVKPTVKA